MIELDKVTKQYASTLAVSELSLEIASGEIFAFLGPNGAGKTTTIKMMIGLLRPTSGQVRIHGIDAIQDSRQANGHIGYVPDQPYLYDKLSGREMLRFVVEMHGVSGNEIEERIDQQIALFELGDFIDQLCESYSHGMKQRVVFASALIHHPEVLIVDEPMVGLDPRSMRLVKDLLQAEAKRGAAVFMSTHTLSVAEEIANRIGIINHGHLCFLGTVKELRQHLDADHSTLEELYLKLTNEQESP